MEGGAVSGRCPAWSKANGFTESGFVDPAEMTNLVNTTMAPFWYRLCDPSASFLVGPQGATGVSLLANEVANPALPYEVYNYQNLGPEIVLNNGMTYYNSFICPSTATYTACLLYTSDAADE